MRRACLERTHTSTDIQHEKETRRPLATPTVLSTRGTQRITERTGRHPKWKRFGKVCDVPDRGALGMRVLLGATPSGLAVHFEQSAREQIQGHLLLPLSLADCAEVEH